MFVKAVQHAPHAAIDVEDWGVDASNFAAMMAVIDYVCEIRAHFIDSTDRRTLYLEGSSWLLHEAFCLFGEADKFKPYEKHHSTVKEACQLAENLGIPNLLLYHTEETHLRERKKLYTEEGSRYYHGNLYVPDDLETFDL